MKKFITHLFFICCFVFSPFSWSKTWGNMKMIHIKDGGEQVIVLKNKENTPIPKSELEGLIKELELYIKCKSSR